MIRRTVTEDLALAILTRSGIGTIWRLHTAAAAVYQIGNPSAATAIAEIADAGRVGKETIVKRGKLLLGRRVL